MNPELIRSTMADGMRHHQAGRLAEARLRYETVLSAQPREADALNLLGMIDYAAGDTALAVSRIEQAIAINPRVPGFHTNLGTVLHADGDNAGAARALRQALAMKPDHLPALCNLGIVLQAMGEFEAAAKAYAAALAINPRLRDVWNSIGNCHARLGNTDAAMQSFRRALQLDAWFPAARINAANLLFTIGQFDEAERILREVVQRDAGQAEAQNNLGLVLMKRDRFPEAAAAFRAALGTRPDYDEAALNLGNALFEQGEQEGAMAQYRSLIARSPDHAAPRLALAMAIIPMMPSSAAHSAEVPQAFDEAIAELEQWSASHPGALVKAVGTVQPFLLAYRPGDATGPLARYGQLMCRAAQAHPRAQSAAPAVTGRSRVRLGIVSGQVRGHPVWQVILRGIVEGLDRERWDVRLYDTGQFRDEETQWAEAHAGHYHRQPLTIEGWADHIGREAPDILFHPEVGMDPVSGALAPLRLARLQVASWGHPVTTGLPTMDLYLSGEAIEPADADAHYTERLIRLPGTGVLTRFGTPQPRRWNGPPRREGRVRFALCQQSMKFDPADDALLAGIAKEGPSEFWIVRSRKHPWASDALARRLAIAFAAAGLEPDHHLRMTPWMDQAEFLGFLDEMDVMLDCPAFSGYTTAWQAIHRGTPIVTLEGRFMRQRLAAGLLRQIGCVDGIAGNREEYLARAVEHADRSRSEAGQRAYRNQLMAAAHRADGNVEAVKAMERHLLRS